MKNSFIQMIKGLSIIFVLFLSLGCNDVSETDPILFEYDDTSLSDSLQLHFYKEASRLALREILENNDDSQFEVTIQEDSLEQYYFALVTLYNITNMSERDTVIDIYQITTYPWPDLNTLTIGIEDTVTWVEGWLTGSDYTTNDQIDSLISLYDLTLSGIHHWSWGGYTTTLVSASPLNLFALAPLFEQIEGVTHTSHSTAGGSDDIIVTKEVDHFILEYHLRWGDCWSGCISDHWWSFMVFFTGEVEFIESQGSLISEYNPFD